MSSFWNGFEKQAASNRVTTLTNAEHLLKMPLYRKLFPSYSKKLEQRLTRATATADRLASKSGDSHYWSHKGYLPINPS